MKTNLLKAILPTVLLSVCICCSDPESLQESSNSTETATHKYNTAELELADMINAHRQNSGLNVLETVPYICFKSREHNQYMIAENAINHDFFGERSQNLIDILDATKVSENVAYNFPTAHGVLQAWLSSEAHRKNIEGDYTHFGISITENPINGNKYYTNIFMKK